MPINHQNYQSYTLRLWRSEESSPWRFSLIHISSGRELHFASLAELMVFLNQNISLPQRRDLPSDAAIKL